MTWWPTLGLKAGGELADVMQEREGAKALAFGRGDWAP